MKTRLPSPGAAQGAWLIAGRWTAGAVLLAATVSACTAGGSGSSVPSVFTPTPVTSGPASGPGTRTPSPTGAGASTRPVPSGPGSSTARPPTTTAPTSTASSRAPGTQAPTATVTRTRVEPTVTRTRVQPTRTVTQTTFPVAAPETGGGGTAGLQDSMLLGVGGLAVLSGLGTLAFRRRLRRSLDRERPARRGGREPADR
jgi:hypothetical protein